MKSEPTVVVNFGRIEINGTMQHELEEIREKLIEQSVRKTIKNAANAEVKPKDIEELLKDNYRKDKIIKMISNYIREDMGMEDYGATIVFNAPNKKTTKGKIISTFLWGNDGVIAGLRRDLAIIEEYKKLERNE